jgi:hypothetical protein
LHPKTKLPQMMAISSGSVISSLAAGGGPATIGGGGANRKSVRLPDSTT